MDNQFFKTKGQLSLVIGQGFLSSFEASTLKKGDLLKSSHLAGYPFNVYYNKGFLCLGEVVVADGVFAIRVSDLEPIEEQMTQFFHVDDVVELLPFQMRLGSIDVSLEELKGISRGSIISLGKPLNLKEDLDLYVAGHHIGKGRTIVHYENMGIRMTRVFGNHYPETNIRTSGFILDKNSDKVKDYDYKRPDKFTRNAIMKIRDIHDYFLKNLKIRKPEFQNMKINIIDQCTFQEAIDILKKRPYWEKFHFTLIQNKSSREKSPEGSFNQKIINNPLKKILEPENTTHPLSQLSVDFINNTLMSEKFPMDNLVYLFTKHHSLDLRNPKNQGDMDYLISCLRGGWKNFVNLNLELTQQYHDFEKLPAISPSDMIILIELVYEKNDSLFLIYPFMTLENLLRILN